MWGATGLVQRCQWHKRGNVVRDLPKGGLADASPTSLCLPDVRRRECRAAPRAKRAGRSHPIGGPESGRRSGGALDPASGKRVGRLL